MTSTTAVPAAREAGEQLDDLVAVSVSSEPVGSSARSSRRSPTMARAMAMRCCCPPEKSSGIAVELVVEADALQSASIAAARAWRGADAVELERQHHVLDRGERRHRLRRWKT